MTVFYRKRTRTTGVDTVHRAIIKRLNKVLPNTLLAVKTFRHGKSWGKYLIIKSTGEKIMLITALFTNEGKTNAAK